MLRRKPMEPKSGRRAVAQTSPPRDGFAAANKSAVSRVFQTSGPLDLAHRADLEICDTADLENCATILGMPWLFSTRLGISYNNARICRDFDEARK